jgi:signal transduction histidine kinase
VTIPRPRLPRPWQWRRRRPGEDEIAEVPARRPANEEDTRLLRQTRLRLMAVSGLVTLLILFVLGALIYHNTADALVNDSVNRLASSADQLQARLRGQGRVPQSPYEMTFGDDGVPFILDAQGKQVYGPRLVGLPDPAGFTAAFAGATDVREITLVGGLPVRVYSVPFTDSTGTIIGVVQTGADRTQEVNLLNTLLWVLLVGGGAALLAALLAGYLYAGRALVPIRASIDRRQAALQRQREFAANASHELRTPLTVIGASVEDLKRNRRSKVEDVGEAIGDIEAEVQHMTALVEDMLLLARTDSGVVQIERAPLDLGDIAAEAAGMLSAVGQERGVRVVLDPLPAPVTGDPMRLRQLVTILVDNAIRHSPAGSTVTAIVRPEAGGALLQVEDQGAGIKEDDLPRIFERFWRADDAPAGGTGLGLAIAKWIVDQHGGSIGAVNRPEGGAGFWVQLPNLPAEQTSPDDESTVPTADQNLWAGPDTSAP